MTGQYAHTNGLMGLVNIGWSMPAETQTSVDYLNAAGYETAHFGFQHERHISTANRYQLEGQPVYPEDDWLATGMKNGPIAVLLACAPKERFTTRELISRC